MWKLSEIYDAEHLIKCICNYTGNTFKIHQAAPSNFKKKNIVFTPKHDSRKINSETNWNSTQTALLKFAQPNTVVDFGRFYARWELKLNDSKSFVSRRLVLKCLKPALPIKKVVSTVTQKMRSTYPSAKIIAIHPRLEDDWKEHNKRNKFDDGWISEEEWCHRLTKNFNITSSTKILLVGGAKFDIYPFDKNNLTTFTKNDFLDAKELSPFKYKTSLAAIDFFLSMEADNFYGFMWSSMDIIIYESRMYNCQHINAIHVGFGDGWLNKVSRWTNSFFFFRLEDIACHYRMYSPTCNNVPTKLSESCLEKFNISTSRV